MNHMKNSPRCRVSMPSLFSSLSMILPMMISAITVITIGITMIIGISVPPAHSAMADAEGPYIISPLDKARTGTRIKVVFGLRGRGVAPAGVERENTGHHHLLIDAGDLDPDKPIPADAHHLHFGGGQTETTIDLKPGRHTLQLVLGDAYHYPIAGMAGDPITITVTDP